jgi:hypothetical protein
MTSGRHDHLKGSVEADLGEVLAQAPVKAAFAKVGQRTSFAYDIPYLGGYSQDGRQVYFDRNLPRHVAIAGKSTMIVKYLKVLETTEKAILLAGRLKGRAFDYQEAHILATQAERRALEADGHDWDAYSKALEPVIAHAARKPLHHVPSDLDLEPYRDEGAKALLARIKAAQR